MRVKSHKVSLRPDVKLFRVFFLLFPRPSPQKGPLDEVWRVLEAVLGLQGEGDARSLRRFPPRAGPHPLLPSPPLASPGRPPRRCRTGPSTTARLGAPG